MPARVGTWHDLDLGRPIAAPLERCAELLGVDLDTICEAASNIEPYLRADGTRIWSLMQLERQLRRYVAGGLLDDQDVTAAFTQAALAIGLQDAEIARTLASARTAGLANRRGLPALLGTEATL
jgi:hypothetical protein